MKKKTFKKLVLKKDVIARLDKAEMQQIVGGAQETLAVTCGANCHSIVCDPHQVTKQDCLSFADGPTCKGTICGSDPGVGCGGGGYSVQICTGNPQPTFQWQCSYYV